MKRGILLNNRLTLVRCFQDFEANRLVSGILQLPAGTHLVVDETVMADCQLDAKAVQNLTALGEILAKK